MTSRQVISESVIEPGTGKAIELLQGQILRVEQIEGGQCADFNCFNLHDYKEFMHCGRTHVVGAAARARDALYSRRHSRTE